MQVFIDVPETGVANPFVAPLEAALRRRCELGLGQSWSWVELGPDEEDYRWLCRWAEGLSPEVLHTWLRRSVPHATTRPVGTRPELVQGYSQRAVAGAAFSFLLAEIGRRDGTEGMLWPCLWRGLPAGMSSSVSAGGDLYPELRAALRKARDVGLRNAFDIDGDRQHSWVVSLRLQFGFTYDGLRNGLCDWLRGAARPRAVDLLLEGGQPSASFDLMWRALHALHHRLGDQDKAWDVIGQTPWLLPEWRDELPAILGITRRARSAKGRQSPGGQLLGDAALVRQARLAWPAPQPPRFILDVPDRIGLPLDSPPPQCTVRLQGDPVGKLFLQRSGGYRAEWDRELLLPFSRLMTAEALLEVVANDAPIWSEATPLWDAAEPYALFDLNTEKAVVDQGVELPQDHLYALLVADGTEVQGLELPAFSGPPNWSVVHVPAGSVHQLGLSRDGRTIWTATAASPAAWLDDVEVAVSTPGPLRVGQPVGLRVERPHDASLRSVWWRGVPLQHTPEPDGSTSLSGLHVPPGPWGGSVHLRLEFERQGDVEQVSRAVDLDRVGVSVLRDNAWAVAAAVEADLGRDGTSLMIIHAPQPSPWGRDWIVAEGTRPLGLPLSRPVRLPTLSAVGQPLRLCGVRYDGQPTEPVTLVERVVNRKLVDGMKEDDHGLWRLLLRQAMPVTDDHAALWWDRDGTLHEVAAEPDSVGWLVQPPYAHAYPRAIAVEYRGSWQGSCWADDWAEELPVEASRSETVMVMRRLRLPVLDARVSGELGAWLRADLADLALAAEVTGDGTTRCLLSAALDGWRPAAGAARQLLLDNAPRLATLAVLQPSVLATVVDAATRGKLPLAANYWLALGHVAGLLAELDRHPHDKLGIKALGLSAKTGGTGLPADRAEALCSLAQAVDGLH